MPLLHCCYAQERARVAPPFAQDPRMPEREAPRSIDPHRSHVGSRYKSGCCGHAGLFRAGSIPSARARELVLSRPWIKENNHTCKQTNSYTPIQEARKHRTHTGKHTRKPSAQADEQRKQARRQTPKRARTQHLSTMQDCEVGKESVTQVGSKKKTLSKPQGRLDLAKKKHIQAGHSPTSSPTRKTQQAPFPIPSCR